MTKPDWAERLQKTFKRKYDLGYHDGYKIGYDEGFLTGSRKAVTEARKVFVKLIEEQAKRVPQDNVEYINALNKSIELIKKGK
jgi:flagellar biosynthesis/type III secretory pathway protein FliH